MIPIFLSLVILLTSINILLGLPKLTAVATDVITSENVVQNQALAAKNTSQPGVIGIEKVMQTPKSLNIPAPSVSATSVLIKDLDTNYIMYAKDPDKRVPIASTTKIMTALVAIEYFQPETILQVPPLPTDIGSNMELKTGEMITFHSLLYGLLLNSGNDAAYTIAQNYPGGLSAFIEAMNKKVYILGLKNTHFDNPAGFDSPNHYSSAYDLSVITTEALGYHPIPKVVATKDTLVTSIDGTQVHPLKNLNVLLEKEGVIGVKTGYTPIAKENLVGLIEKDGHRILTVVLGSNDRFGETEKLMDWAYQNFVWE